MDIKKTTKKITLPIAIVISAIVLAIGFYVVQYNKQQSIEKQQAFKFLEDRNIQNAKAKKDKEETIFSNNLKCQTLLKDLNERWNNVVGIYYSERQNTCIVKFTKDGEIEEGPIERMQDAE